MCAFQRTGFNLIIDMLGECRCGRWGMRGLWHGSSDPLVLMLSRSAPGWVGLRRGGCRFGGGQESIGDQGQYPVRKGWRHREFPVVDLCRPGWHRPVFPSSERQLASKAGETWDHLSGVSISCQTNDRAYKSMVRARGRFKEHLRAFVSNSEHLREKSLNTMG